jgi:hypothetical protein
MADTPTSIVWAVDQWRLVIPERREGTGDPRVYPSICLEGSTVQKWG